ncbi:MAG: GerMN domain-containing protein [Deltaproteobacteria bacterium]
MSRPALTPAQRPDKRSSRRGAVSPWMALAVLALLALAAPLLLAACGAEETPTASDGTPAATTTATPPATETPAASPSPSETAAGETTVLVYFLRGEELGTAERTLPQTVAVARAAMEALVGGPNADEKAAGLGTAIPKGTRLLGISVDGAVATVDLSGEFASGGGSLSMTARVAQVVYTMTQFKTIRAVAFMLDGERVATIGGEGVIVDDPQRRADWQDFEPTIFVERPGVGATLSSPFVVQGRATVFEATVNIDLLDAGEQALVETFTTATMGAPGRGAFSKKIAYTSESDSGWLVVYEASAKDGSHLNEVRIPVSLL